MNISESIEKFLSGEINIISFKKMYDEDDKINDYLQNIVNQVISKKIKTKDEEFKYFANPDLYEGVKYGNNPYSSVRQFLTHEFRMITHNVNTAEGANNFYNDLLLIYKQEKPNVLTTDKYEKEWLFAIDVIPQYATGEQSEKYIYNNIFPMFPNTMNKNERKKGIRNEIKKVFKTEKRYPTWIQYGEWPIGSDGQPMLYIKRKNLGEKVEYFFKDESNGKETIIEQFY